MDLRPELLPPAVHPGTMSNLGRQARRIVSLIDSGAPCEAEIAAFNSATGRGYTRADFDAFPGSESVEDFVARAVRPERPQVPDITREELIEIVDRVMTASDDADYYLDIFTANVPHPEASDLMFWPPEELTDASSAEIVDAALAP